MSRSNARPSILFIMIATCLAFVASPARSEWPQSGLPVATGAAWQDSPVGLTGPGGELHAFWAESAPTTYALYAQHLMLQGTPAPGWPAGGRGVVAAPAAISTPLRVITDGSGGAILTWYDSRNVGGPRGMYAIRVDAEASIRPGWISTGTLICPAPGPLSGAGLEALCGDGAGGAFIAWTDNRNTPTGGTLIYDVFAHHVLANGTLDPSWPAAGRALTTGGGYKYPHALVADGSGGFWLAAENSNATYQVAVTHHGSDGSETGRWASPSYASRVVGVSDGVGGIFAAWSDCRDCVGGGSDAIYAMRLVAPGIPRLGWPAGGVEMGASVHEDNLPVIVGTGDGAVMVAWRQTGGASDAHLCRKVGPLGTFGLAWQAGPREFVTTSTNRLSWTHAAPDGEGGAMFAFLSGGLFGSRVDAAAQVPAAFPDTGLALCTVPGLKSSESIISDGLNGAFVLWADGRDQVTNKRDVYAMRFTRDGIVGSTTGIEPPPVHPAVPTISLSAPRPNPASGPATFELTMPAAAHARLEVRDLFGRLIAVLHEGQLAAGTSVLSWDGRDRDGRRMPPGVYLARARTSSQSVSQRMVRLPE